jgi:long-chain acyl-CoA synthetase
MSSRKRNRKETSSNQEQPTEASNKVLESDKPWFKFWPEGVPKHIEYPLVSLAEILRKSARANPNQTSTVYFDKRLTYGELDDAVDRFAAALTAIGVKKGDKVAIFLPNMPQFVISYYGTLRIGAVETAISPLYKEREVEHQLKDSEAETIVVLDALYPILERVLAATKVKNIIVTSLKDYMPRSLAILGSVLRKIPSHILQLSNTQAEQRE